MSVRNLWPRRAADLPPGQREIREFPRFSDKPLRWAPAVSPIELTISLEGDAVATLGAQDLAEFGNVAQTSDFHCVTTWSYRGLRWSGVSLGPVVHRVLGRDVPAFAVASAGDRQQAIFMTEDLLADDVLLATRLDDQPIDRKHGAPLRLICPGQYGYKNVKHLTGLDFRKDEPASTLGSKEHLRARVALEERHAALPNWLLRIPYRLTIIPAAIAGERGLRNSPN